MTHTYLTVTCGPDAERAEPVFVSDDPLVIRAAFEAMRSRLNLEEPIKVEAESK